MAAGAARPSSRSPWCSSSCCATTTARETPRRWRWPAGTLEAMARGRHLRPAGRRLPPLLGRRRLARAPLREDALRQRPAGPRLPPRLAGHGNDLFPDRRRGDARLRGAGDDRSRRRRSTRTQDADSEGTGRQVLSVDAGRGPRRAGRRSRTSRRLRRLRSTATSKAEHPRVSLGDIDQRPALAAARRKLFAAREQRVHPGRDEKVLTSWNGLMLAAFAEAARALNRPDYRLVADATPISCCAICGARTAGCSTAGRPPPSSARQPAGPSKTASSRTMPASSKGCWSCIRPPLSRAGIRRPASWPRRRLPTSGVGRRLLRYQRRPRDTDHPPSRFAGQCHPFGRRHGGHRPTAPGRPTLDMRFTDLAERSLGAAKPWMEQYPLGFAQWLIAADYALAKRQEIAIVGDIGAADTSAMLAELQRSYHPYRTLAVGAPAESADASSPSLYCRDARSLRDEPRPTCALAPHASRL